jgi:hypothetical protein
MEPEGSLPLPDPTLSQTDPVQIDMVYNNESINSRYQITVLTLSLPMTTIVAPPLNFISKPWHTEHVTIVPTVILTVVLVRSE